MCKEKYVLLYLVKALIVLPLGDVKKRRKMYTSQLATSICYSFFSQYQVEIPLLFRHYFDMYAVPTFITVTVFVISLKS